MEMREEVFSNVGAQDIDTSGYQVSDLDNVEFYRVQLTISPVELNLIQIRDLILACVNILCADIYGTSSLISIVLSWLGVIGIRAR